MTWSLYASFVVFAVVLIVMRGPDFAVVTRNTLTGGRMQGTWTGAGVASAAAVQGVLAASGLGAVIAATEPVFRAVKWAGVAYLLVLAVQSFRSALRGDYAPLDSAVTVRGARGWRQGFLCNITNPKVLVFYLAVLPQFLGPHPTVLALLALALTHAVLSVLYLTFLVLCLHRAGPWLSRRPVRRALDAITGTALLGFSLRILTD